MKTKPRLSHIYIFCGALPKKEYPYGTGKSAIESLLSQTEGADREKRFL